jgi:peptidyl-prolyl cis-trans isomerase C
MTLLSRSTQLLALVLLAAFGLQAGASELGESHAKALSIEFSSEALLIADGVTITEAEIDSYLDGIPDEDLGAFLSNPRRLAEGVQGQANNQLLAVRGIEAGILDDPLISAEVYRSVMEKLASRHMDRVVSSRLLSDYSERARELYLAEPERFREPKTYSFTHLLIRTDERGESEAMREILAARDQLQSGASFDELVQEFSEDPGAKNNDGRYEQIALDSLDRNFARELRRMDGPGVADEPVRSQFGWHLIRLDAIHEGDVMSWEEARDQAVQLAQEQHEERIRRTYLGDVLDTESLETVPNFIERFQQKHSQSQN